MGFYLLERAVNNGTQWQQWTYPRRGAKLSGTVIMHTSESVLDVIGPDSTAEDCAAFIGRRTGSYGSYHDIVDSDSIIEMVPFEYEAWQDSETNNWAVGISAACRTTDWATMGEAKREGFYRNLAWCAADFVKYMREAYNIEVPRRRISGAEARNRVPGFCAHGDSGLYRSDPGKDFDWNRFFRYTNEALNGEDEVGHVDSISDEAARKIADALMWRDVPWYGYDGNQPKEGRTTTTLGIQLGWLDTAFSSGFRITNESRTAILAVLETLKQLPDIDNELIDKLSAQLSESLKSVTENIEVTLKSTPPTP